MCEEDVLATFDLLEIFFAFFGDFVGWESVDVERNSERGGGDNDEDSADDREEDDDEDEDEDISCSGVDIGYSMR